MQWLHVCKDYKLYQSDDWAKGDSVFRKYAQRSAVEVVLIGLDGGVKRRFGDTVQPEAVWALIDKMPMRRAEMRKGDGF